MTNVNSEDLYLNWLIEIVSDEEHQNFKRILEYLMNVDFRWSVPMDENRAEDGVHLRFVYEDLTGNLLPNLQAPCTVLEMMVALAVRGAEDILWDGVTNWTPIIFWTMIENLGLSEYVDDSDLWYESRIVTKDNRIIGCQSPELERIINDFLDRNYDENGVGGLFLPVHNFIPNPKKWKKIEIWYQMAYWINDNFL